MILYSRPLSKHAGEAGFDGQDYTHRSSSASGEMRRRGRSKDFLSHQLIHLVLTSKDGDGESVKVTCWDLFSTSSPAGSFISLNGSPTSALLRWSPLNQVKLCSPLQEELLWCFRGTVNWIISSTLPHKRSARLSHREQAGNLSRVSCLAAVPVQPWGEHTLSPEKSSWRVYYRKKHFCLIYEELVHRKPYLTLEIPDCICNVGTVLRKAFFNMIAG